MLFYNTLETVAKLNFLNLNNNNLGLGPTCHRMILHRGRDYSHYRVTKQFELQIGQICKSLLDYTVIPQE